MVELTTTTPSIARLRAFFPLVVILSFGFGMQQARAQAGSAPPTVQVAFSPSSIASGGTSNLNIALGNANGTAASLSNPLVDSLPAGLVVASSTVSNSCGGAVNATTGNAAISFSGSIPAGGCSIGVSVKATSSSNTYFTDTIPSGALQTNFGSNLGGASATLTVRAAVTVPNLQDLSQAAAAAALQAVGLTLGTVSHQASTTVPYNLVANQTPVHGTSVPAGTAVTIYLSTGPNGGTTASHDPLASSASSTDPTAVSVAAAVDRVCADLQTPGATLNSLQKNLLANCKALVETYGNGGNATGLKGALDAVSGKQTTAQQRAGIEFSGTQFQNIGARLAQLRQGVSGFSFADLNTGGIPLPGDFGQLLAMLKDPSSRPEPGSASPGAPVSGGGAGDSPTGGGLSRWGFFVNGSLLRGTQDTTDEETGFTFKSNGVTAGVDYRLTDYLVFGLAAGHSNGNTQFTDGSGRIDSLSNTGSLYGTFYQGPFYVDAIGTFGHIDYSEYRTTSFDVASITAGNANNCGGSTGGTLSGCTIDTNGRTGAREFALGTSAGYSFHGGGFIFGPDVALDWTHIDVNGFTENDPGNTGMALAYDGQIGESLLLKAGGHVSYALSTPFAVILPQVRAHYIHEFKNDQRAMEVHYVDDPTVNSATGPISDFSVFTDRPDRNYADWAASITAQFPFGLSAFVDYDALAGYSQLQTHELTFGIRFQAVVR